MMKNHWKILESGSVLRSSPKSNQLVLVTLPTRPPSFIQIRRQLFEISCNIVFSPISHGADAVPRFQKAGTLFTNLGRMTGWVNPPGVFHTLGAELKTLRSEDSHFNREPNNRLIFLSEEHKIKFLFSWVIKTTKPGWVYGKEELIRFWWRSKSRSGSGSSPKSNQFVLAHTQPVHQVSSKSVHNFLRYCAIYRFSPISQWWRIT